jgi:ATP-binding cassette, subfamily C (CFTR/MRP), member 1
VITCLRIGFLFFDDKEVSFAIDISLFSQLAALWLVAVILPKNHRKSRHSSTLFLVSWPLYLVVFAIWARTSHNTGWFAHHPVEFRLSVALAVIGFALWMVECIGPEHGPGAYHPIGKDLNESPFQTANVYSRWTFYWMDNLMRLGSKRPLEEEDVYVLGPKDQTDVLAEKLERASKKHKNLWASLAVAYGSTYAYAGVLKIVQDLLAFAQPQFLRMFLAYISRFQASSDPETPNRPSPIQGFVIVAGMFLSATIQTIVLHQVSPPR